MVISLNALQIYAGREEVGFDGNFDGGVQVRGSEAGRIRVGHLGSCGGEREGTVEGREVGFGRRRSVYAVTEKREGSPSSTHSLRGRVSSGDFL